MIEIRIPAQEPAAELLAQEIASAEDPDQAALLASLEAEESKGPQSEHPESDHVCPNHSHPDPVPCQGLQSEHPESDHVPCPDSSHPDPVPCPQSCPDHSHPDPVPCQGPLHPEPKPDHPVSSESPNPEIPDKRSVRATGQSKPPLDRRICWGVWLQAYRLPSSRPSQSRTSLLHSEVGAGEGDGAVEVVAARPRALPATMRMRSRWKMSAWMRAGVDLTAVLGLLDPPRLRERNPTRGPMPRLPPSPQPKPNPSPRQRLNQRQRQQAKQSTRQSPKLKPSEAIRP